MTDSDRRGHRQFFAEELRQILYASGGDDAPREDTVQALEDCLSQFLEGVIIKSYKRTLRRDPRAGTINQNELIYVVKDDLKI